jgi:serine/threonine protein phosphatase PrpC
VVGAVSSAVNQRLDTQDILRLPSVQADAGQVGPFWLAAASAAGLAHLNRGKTGQDCYSYLLADDGRSVVAAVADGLGSKPHSHLGALTLTRLLCRELAGVPFQRMVEAPRDHLARAVQSASDQAENVVKLGLVRDVGELACTIAFCWIPQPGTAGGGYAGRVGDSSLFVLDPGGLHQVFRGDDGPINVVSASLPNAAAGTALELTQIDFDAFSAAILVTDGLAGDLLDSQTIREWLTDRWARPCAPDGMIESLRYRRQGSHDDRTALVIWPSSDHRRGGDWDVTAPAKPSGSAPRSESGRRRRAGATQHDDLVVKRLSRGSAGNISGPPAAGSRG